MSPKHRPNIPRKVRLAVYERDGWTCRYCGLKFDPKRTWNPTSLAPYVDDERLGQIFLTLDHVLPRYRGGQDTAANLVAACAPCNRQKSFNVQEVSE